MRNELDQKSGGIYFLGIVLAFSVFAILVWWMYGSVEKTTIDAQRIQDRREAAQGAREDAAVLQQTGMLKQDLGIVQLPIGRAKQIILEKWQDPATLREQLLARVDKANPPPPEPPPAPAQPEEPSPFE